MAWKPIIDRDKNIKCYIASLLLSPITLPFNINCIIVAAYNSSIDRQAVGDKRVIPLDLDDEMLDELIITAIMQASNDIGCPIKSREEATKIHQYLQNHEELSNCHDLYTVLLELVETGVLVEADGKWGIN